MLTRKIGCIAPNKSPWPRSVEGPINHRGRKSLPVTSSHLPNKNIRVLRQFVFVYDLETRYEAYTILANALLLNESLLNSFDPASYVGTVLTDLAGRRSVSGKLHALQDDKTVLLLRLLFLFTLKGVQSIKSHVMACLNMISTRIYAIERNGIPKSQAWVIELLKVLFNLLHNYPEPALDHFAERADSLVAILQMATEDINSYLELHRYVCNVLLCSPPQHWQDQQVAVVSCIFPFLQVALEADNVNDATVLAELSLLQNISVAQRDPRVAELLRSRLVPSPQDRKTVLGKSNSLISLMLRATTNINLSQSRLIIYGILWKVCDESRRSLADLTGLISHFGI